MPPSSKSRGVSRRDLLKGAAAAGIGVTTGALSHGYVYERHHLELTRETMNVSGLPSALAGLRIGLITDLHRSDTVPHALVTRAVRLLMSEAPDLVVLGGDYVTWGDRHFVIPAAEALAPLSAPHGVYAVLGNHDDDRDMPAALSATGVIVLRDARTRLIIRGEILDLAGIRFWTRRVSDIAHVLRGASPNVILLAHNPLRLVEAAALAVQLVLSGHTHGGQVVLPGIGAVAAREFPVIAGRGRRESTGIFVSRGVGTVYVPVRLNCPPEVAVLTLQPVLPTA
ncbi:MAG TPA: metallophosphoesterase [Gemmatimonadaceae bacterium]|nr:metallophosphoesterase [Gemmatimonadaceae bacterium]